MKLEDVKSKIDKYFDNIQPQEVVNKFQDWGYELGDLVDLYVIEKLNNIQFPIIKHKSDFNFRKTKDIEVGLNKENILCDISSNKLDNKITSSSKKSLFSTKSLDYSNAA